MNKSPGGKETEKRCFQAVNEGSIVLVPFHPTIHPDMLPINDDIKYTWLSTNNTVP